MGTGWSDMPIDVYAQQDQEVETDDFDMKMSNAMKYDTTKENSESSWGEGWSDMPVDVCAQQGEEGEADVLDMKMIDAMQYDTKNENRESGWGDGGSDLPFDVLSLLTICRLRRISGAAYFSPLTPTLLYTST